VSLTPHQRKLRSRMGAAALHAQGKTNTEAARAKSPQSLAYWAAKLDPNGELPEAERLKRAEHARREHMLRLALASSRARSVRRKLGGSSDPRPAA
jgi:hypothetical protein